MITDEDVTIEEKRQYLLDCGYPARAIARLNDAEVEQWVLDEIEEQEKPDEDERCDYERHSLSSSYYEDARFL